MTTISTLISLSFWFLLIYCTILIAYRVLKHHRNNKNDVRRFLYSKSSIGENKPIVIGHRAAHFEAPENTLIAIRTAHTNGATAVELDLEFTKDHHAVILHDDTIGRTTNGNGVVNCLSFEELRKYNAAFKANTLRYKDGFSKEAGFQYIPTLEEAVQLCVELDMKIILDVKSSAQMTADAVNKLSQKIKNLPNYIFVTSFFPNILYKVKSTCPAFHTALIWRPNYASLTIDGKPRFTGPTYMLMKVIDFLGKFALHSWLPDFLGIDAVSLHKDSLSWNYVQEWHSKGIDIIAWTVNNPQEKKYLLERFKIPIITDSILNSENVPEQEF